MCQQIYDEISSIKRNSWTKRKEVALMLYIVYIYALTSPLRSKGCYCMFAPEVIENDPVSNPCIISLILWQKSYGIQVMFQCSLERFFIAFRAHLVVQVGRIFDVTRADVHIVFCENRFVKSARRKDLEWSVFEKWLHNLQRRPTCGSGTFRRQDPQDLRWFKPKEWECSGDWCARPRDSIWLYVLSKYKCHASYRSHSSTSIS